MLAREADVVARVALRLLLWSVVASLCFASSARAIPGNGPHETVDVTATTKKPNASTGLRWVASYRSAGNPHGTPPALRRLVMKLPRGSHYDTSVTARCTASDAELMLLGDSACPAGSRIGTSQARVLITGLGESTVDGVDFNGDHQLIEVFTQGGRTAGIARTYAHGNTLDGPVSTCLTGGDPPTGCPFDQVTLLSNRISIPALTVSHGGHRRNYATTPKSCPRSRRWHTAVTLYYSDGSVDHLVSEQPCKRHRHHHS